MPSNYAHYRFGCQALPSLPKNIQRSVSRFRRLYDVGMHGPDIFFHYNIIMQTPVGRMASTMHEETGTQFFTRACKRLRMHPSEAGMVYLYGFLGHFCLDSICHPFVHAHTDEGPIGHVELETEFDRFLLEKDGKQPFSRQDFSAHMRLSRNEAATAAELLHPLTPSQVYRSTAHMALNTHLLSRVNPRLISAALKPLGPAIAHQQMPDQENTHCSFLNGEFYSLYCHALERYPHMARQLAEHLDHRAPFGEEFDRIYG